MDKERTLEQLEQEVWSKCELDSRLVSKCNELRKKPIKDLSIEDLRLLIGQNVGLKFLVPMAIELLQEDILAEGDFYEGDLLINVLAADAGYWSKNHELWTQVCQIFNENRRLLEKFDTSGAIRESWFSSFAKFETYTTN